MTDDAPRQITVILPRDGRAAQLVAALHEEMGIHASAAHSARGTGMGGQRRGQFGMEMEKDIVQVIVPAHDADAVFAFIHAFTEMDTAHGGFMFQARLGRTHFPELPTDLTEAVAALEATEAGGEEELDAATDEREV